MKQNSQPDEIDEDKSFLMSLLPSFKKFDDQQKLAAKVEFLQVIQKITLGKKQAYPQHNQNTFDPSRYIRTPTVSNYYSTFTPSPGPSCSTSLSYVSSPDNTTFLSSDSELLELQ